MGCDIHLWAEFYDQKRKEWRIANNPIETCRDCNGTGKIKKGNCYWCGGNGERRPPFYDGRCYDDFAILANVRNGRGFGGLKTGDGFNYISEPKGVPKNASVLYKRHVHQWEGDGHSHSYLTLKELLDFDWGQTTGHQGIVSANVYADWVAKGRKGPPRTWCGDIDGPKIIKISPEVMDKKIASGEIKITALPSDNRELFGVEHDHTDSGPYYYTLAQWEEGYKESAHNLWNQTIPKLQAFAAKRKLAPEHIRILFFFDN